MMNSISSGMQMPPPPPRSSGSQSLTDDQQAQITDILSQYSADELTEDDAKSIVESFSELGITPGKALQEAMSANGFDAKEVGDLAGVGPQKGQQGEGGMQPPPPPRNEVSSSTELVSFLENILEDYDDQLTDDEKDSILSAVRDEFGLESGQSIINLSV